MPDFNNNTYNALNELTKETLAEIAEVSPNSRVIIAIEDKDSSIFYHSEGMLNSDIFGLLSICYVRLSMLETKAYNERMQLAADIDRYQQKLAQAVITDGKVN